MVTVWSAVSRTYAGRQAAANRQRGNRDRISLVHGDNIILMSPRRFAIILPLAGAAMAQPPLPGLRIEPIPGGSILYVRNWTSQPLTAYLSNMMVGAVPDCAAVIGKVNRYSQAAINQAAGRSLIAETAARIDSRGLDKALARLRTSERALAGSKPQM